MFYKGPVVLGSTIGNVKCSIILNFKVCSNTFSVTGSKIKNNFISEKDFTLLERTEKQDKWSSTHRITVTSYTIQPPKMANVILGLKREEFPVVLRKYQCHHTRPPVHITSSEVIDVIRHLYMTALVIFAAGKTNLGRSRWKAGIWGMKGLWSLPGSRGAEACWATLLNRRLREDVAPVCKYGRRINAGGKAGIIVTDLT